MDTVQVSICRKMDKICGYHKHLYHVYFFVVMTTGGKFIIVWYILHLLNMYSLVNLMDIWKLNQLMERVVGVSSSTKFYYDEDREYCTTESLAISRNGNVVAMTRGLHNSTEFDRITLFRSV